MPVSNRHRSFALTHEPGIAISIDMPRTLSFSPHQTLSPHQPQGVSPGFRRNSNRETRSDHIFSRMVQEATGCSLGPEDLYGLSQRNQCKKQRQDQHCMAAC